MAKSKIIIPKEAPESMLDQKTYEDFNKEQPSVADPNFKINATPGDKKPADKKGIVSGGVKMIAPSFTCAKHPEVISAKPGNCPKCGMRLVKKG